MPKNGKSQIAQTAPHQGFEKRFFFYAFLVGADFSELYVSRTSVQKTSSSPETPIFIVSGAVKLPLCRNPENAQILISAAKMVGLSRFNTQNTTWNRTNSRSKSFFVPFLLATSLVGHHFLGGGLFFGHQKPDSLVKPLVVVLGGEKPKAKRKVKIIRIIKKVKTKRNKKKKKKKKNKKRKKKEKKKKRKHNKKQKQKEKQLKKKPQQNNNFY